MKKDTSSLLSVLMDYYYSLCRIWIFNRPLRTRMDLNIWCLKYCVKLLNKKTTLYPTLSSWLLASSESSYKLSKLLIKLRFLFFPIFIFWPVIAFFLAITKRKWNLILQWKAIICRFDLFFFETRGPYTETDIESTLSCMPHIIFSNYDLNHGDNPEYAIDHKNIFYRRVKKHRLPVINNLSKQEIINIMDHSPETMLILKPENGSQGKKISIIKAKDIEKSKIKTKQTVYQKLLKNPSLIEKIVSSNAGLCTLRMITYVHQNHIDVLGSIFKLSREGSLIDNFHCGGIAVSVDKNGILYRGVSNELEFDNWNMRNSISSHPDTGILFEGIKLPFFEEAKQLCCLTHKKIAPNIFLIGFDVALTENGPILIEANVCSGFLELLINPDRTEYWNELINRINHHGKHSPN